MARRIACVVLCVGFGVAAFACGSASQSRGDSPSATPAQTQSPNRPKGQSPDAAAPSSKRDEPTSPATPQTQEEAPPAEPTPENAAASAALHHKVTPIEVMTRRGTAYLIDYDKSGALESASSACADKAKKTEAAAWAELAEKAAKEAREGKPKAPTKADAPAAEPPEETKPHADGDAAKKTKPKPKAEEDEALKAAEAQENEIAEKVEAVRTQCLREAKEKFEAHVICFRRDGLGHTKFIVYRRNGGSLKELYNANVELDDSQPNKVKVEFKEGGTGKRPILRDRSKFEVAVPNDYSLELEDPQFGRLPYLAKVGLVGN